MTNEEEIEDRLRGLASRYGKVVRIWHLPQLAKAEENDSVYLVDFEMITEALSASSALGIPMAGLNTVMVTVTQVRSS